LFYLIQSLCIFVEIEIFILAFFAWSATLGKILTLDRLKQWHIIIVDWSYMCKKNGETVDHLLLYCVPYGTLFSNYLS
jgi:hypothetical protein